MPNLVLYSNREKDNAGWNFNLKSRETVEFLLRMKLERWIEC